MLVLPEMWTSDMRPQWIACFSKIERCSCKTFSQHSCRFNDGKQREQDIFNTAYIINSQGMVITSYAQVHCQRDIRPAITPGSEAVTFDLDGICCGIILGHDLRFPEFVRQLAVKGAKVLFVPGMWRGPQEIHWKLLNIVRAIENQFFVAAVNRAGTTGNVSYPGMSMVVNPWGEVLVEGDHNPDVLTTVINISLVDKVREQNPFLIDRRPDLYKD